MRKDDQLNSIARLFLDLIEDFPEIRRAVVGKIAREHPDEFKEIIYALARD